MPLMTRTNFVSSNEIRSMFSAAMSAMYRTEVPAYGTLMDLVAKVNQETLDADPRLRERLEDTDSLDRITEERHGAIRLGTPAELAMMRRLFAVMGMYPVGYYDLSTAGVPVHSTAFRPVGDASLKKNPFRIFTSLLRLDLIADETLRAEAEATLAKRQIFTPGAIALTEKAEQQGGLDRADASRFVTEALETFRWHDKALVSPDMYARLHAAHRLIADVVSFKGPHINHLTPRTLDIDLVQARMPDYGIAPKAVVEGPPTRKCPILLRQTSFKALNEPVLFEDKDGSWKEGSHTARFGEIEQRGIALTPKGRALYDELLTASRLGGKAGRLLSSRSRFRGRTRDGELAAYVDFLIEDSGMRLGVCDWGYCVYRAETAACIGDERSPNPLWRTESTCVSCANFAVTERHRPVWQARLERNLALIADQRIDGASRALANARIAECDRILSDLSAIEGPHGQAASRKPA
jgi:uncharacterized glyoxalase superfamily metalloenzyme YdcJ